MRRTMYVPALVAQKCGSGKSALAVGLAVGQRNDHQDALGAGLGEVACADNNEVQL